MDIVFSEFKRPASLTGVEILSSTEVCQVLMVVVNGGWECGFLNIMSPGAKGADNAKKLSIIDLIVSFCG